MKVSEILDVRPEDIRSDLPPGGSPAVDRAYSEWVAGFLDVVHPRVLDRLTGPHGEILATATQVERAVNSFSITQHVFKWLIGWKFPDGTGPNYQHRLRFVSVQFKLRPGAIEAEAEAYIDRVTGELRARYNRD